MSAGHYLKTLRENRAAGSCATCTVASNDAPDSVKLVADYVCDGTDDHLVIQEAVDSLDALGGMICLSEGVFDIGDVIDVTVPIDWHGVGMGEKWAGSAPYGYYGTILSAQAGLTTKMMHVHGEHYCGALYDIGISGSDMDQGTLATAQAAIHLENRGDYLISHCGFTELPFADPLWMNNHGSWVGFCDFEYCKKVTTGAIHVQSARNWVTQCYFSENNAAIEIGTSEFNVNNCVFVDSDAYHIAAVSAEKVNVSNCRFKTWNQGGAGYDAILFGYDATRHHTFTNNIFDGASCDGTHGISDNGKTIDDIMIVGNDFHGFGAVSPVLMTSAGSNCIVRDNLGYVTENSGTATLVSGTTAIAVTHGLSVTPVAGDVVVTPIEAWGNMTQFYIDTYTATEFTIHADINPAQDVDFAWKAIVL